MRFGSITSPEQSLALALASRADPRLSPVLSPSCDGAHKVDLKAVELERCLCFWVLEWAGFTLGLA